MKFYSSVALAMLFTLVSPNTLALSRVEQVMFKQGKQTLKVASSQQAAQMVKSRLGGKILKVQRQKVNGNPGYRVKLIKKNGRIVSVLVDARSGRISG